MRFHPSTERGTTIHLYAPFPACRVPRAGRRPGCPSPSSKLARTIPSRRTSRLVSNCACHSYPRKAEGCRLRFAMGAALSLRSRSHPPNPAHAETCASPSVDDETHCSKVRSNHPSKLACTSFLRGGLGGFQLRAWTSTGFLKIRWIWCTRSASKGSCLARPLVFH